MKRVRQLQMEQKYDQALDMVNEILFLDDQNPAALALRDAIRSTQLYKNFADYERDSEFGFSEQGVDNQKSKIPPRKNMSGPGDRSTSGIMTYPYDWSDLTNRRLGSVSGFSDSIEDRKIRVAMEQSTGEPVTIGNPASWRFRGIARRVTPIWNNSLAQRSLLIGRDLRMRMSTVIPRLCCN